MTFVQNDDFLGVGDNEVKAFASTTITPNLGSSTVPDFTVSTFAPGSVTSGQNGVAVTITGATLTGGAPCNPFVYLIQETFTDTGGVRTIIKVNVTGVTGGNITGTLNAREVNSGAAAPTGAYTLKVFIKDKVQTISNAMTVTAPP